jgi:hypothetical protein
MRTLLRTSLPLILGAWSVGCNDSTAAPLNSAQATTPATSKPTPTVVRFVVTPDTSTLLLGSDISLAAYKVLSDSSRLPVAATWSSGDEGIVAINTITGRAVAIGPGQITILARFETYVGWAVITVSPSKNLGPSDALVVEQFSFIEFHFPSAPGQIYYAPQMRAHAPPGHRVSVLAMKFSIPGLGNVPVFGCGANLTDAVQDLFGEVYGDWLLEIGGSAPATGPTGSVTVSFVDDSGFTGTSVVTGPIVRGSLPTSYSGGADGGACFHGYGSSG